MGEVKYLIKKVTEEASKDLPAVEQVLTKIRDDGGNVLYDKNPLTKEVNVLWVQTQEMRKHVSQEPLSVTQLLELSHKVTNFMFNATIAITRTCGKWLAFCF